MSLEELYLKYLVEITGLPRSYERLCSYINGISFLYDPHFVTDGNRIDDGLELRSLYFHDTGKSSGMPSNEASVFEVMVALAIRIDRDIMGEPGTIDPKKWLLIMFENLGLKEDTDEDDISKKIEDLIYRRYKANGEGSLFPLKKSKLDQRGISIWDQMNEYMVENY